MYMQFYFTSLSLSLSPSTLRVTHANSWKLIKSHFHTIFTDIIFPLMCYSDEDDALWDSDPYEYIRMKFGKKRVKRISARKWLKVLCMHAYVITTNLCKRKGSEGIDIGLIV